MFSEIPSFSRLDMVEALIRSFLLLADAGSE